MLYALLLLITVILRCHCCMSSDLLAYSCRQKSAYSNGTAEAETLE